MSLSGLELKVEPSWALNSHRSPSLHLLSLGITEVCHKAQFMVSNK